MRGAILFLPYPWSNTVTLYLSWSFGERIFLLSLAIFEDSAMKATR
jgi:hypothetical protein